eukprot:gene5839-8056_t
MFSILRRSKELINKYFPIKLLSIEITSLPFKITPNEALDILSKNHSFFEKKINDNEQYIGKNLQKVYIPFHTAIVKQLESKYAGQKGIDRTESYTVTVPNSDGKGSHTEQRSRIVTDWYNVTGKTSLKNYNTKLEDYYLHIYGGFDYPKQYVCQSLVTTSLKRSDYMKIKVDDAIKVRPHDMNYSKAFDDILKHLFSCEKNRAEQHIIDTYRCDRSHIDSLHLNLEEIILEKFSYHIPAYIYTSRIEDKMICKIVNGYNGNCSGDSIYCELKFGLFGSIVGGVIGLASLLWFPIYMSIPRLIMLRLGMTTVAGGLVGGLSSFLYTEYKYNSTRSQIEQDKQENLKSEESMEDMKRKRLEYDTINDNNTNERNYNNNNNNNNNNRTTSYFKEYQLLELNSRKPLTRQLLVDARNKMLLKWHPDIYNGDRDKATLMSSQINEAYSTLLRSL